MAILRSSKPKVGRLLDTLAEVQERQAALELLYAQQVKANPELQQIQAGIDQVKAKSETLRDEIKAAVLRQGQTVKGQRLQAVWNRGRTSWDIQRLEGYLVAHPELAELKSTGEPTVSIRKA